MVNAVINLEIIGHPLYAVIQHLIIDSRSEFYDKSQQYRVLIKIHGDEVASGMDFSQYKAACKAIEVAHEYLVKKGFIVPAKTTEQFSFSTALDLLKQGQKICRKGWNGKGMWLSYLDPYHNNQFSITEKDGAEGTFSPYIGMKTADNKYVPWLASQTDLLADDWMISA